MQQLEAQAVDQAAEQFQNRKEREQQRAQEKKRQQREDAVGEVAKKLAPTAKPPIGAKPEQSVPKRHVDAKPQPKAKRTKEDAKEASGAAPPPVAVPRVAAGPPLSVDEMAELVVRLTRAMEAAPPDEVAIAAVLAALQGTRMTLELLRETGVGKVVNTLKKVVRPALADHARALVDQWKTLKKE